MSNKKKNNKVKKIKNNNKNKAQKKKKTKLNNLNTHKQRNLNKIRIHQNIFMLCAILSIQDVLIIILKKYLIQLLRKLSME